jgi:hypothetical protein
MNMMLLLIFASVGVGLFGRRLERRAPTLAIVIATALTLIYFFRPAYMT